MNERQHGGNLICSGRSHCAWLELALVARSLIVSGTGQKTLLGPRKRCIIQSACLKKKRERERERGGEERRVEGGGNHWLEKLARKKSSMSSQSQFAVTVITCS